MAVVRNSVSRPRSTSNTAAGVMADLNKWYEQIHARAEEKVEEAVSTITNTTNSKYSGVPAEGNQIAGNPIYYKMYTGKSIITGKAIARESKELIYLEFGTRNTEKDSLRIVTGWESGIDTISISAPYKSNSPRFVNKKASAGTYYFLSTTDIEGMNFIRRFWK
jgi:hypothetical protein